MGSVLRSRLVLLNTFPDVSSLRNESAAKLKLNLRDCSDVLIENASNNDDRALD